MSLKDIAKYIYRKPQHGVIKLLSNIFAKPLNIDLWQKYLIIAPHPDDEVFGCGGLIEILTSRNKVVNILFLSKGEASISDESMKEKVIRKRKGLAEIANISLGISLESIKWLDFPDGKFNNVSEATVKRLDSMIESLSPDVVFYPHHWDGSPDHIVASSIIYEIINNRKIEGLEYCVWLWHHMPLLKAFLLNYNNSFLLPIENVEKKKSAVNIYAEAVDESGVYYSGRLPKMFLKAVTWKKELYFRNER